MTKICSKCKQELEISAFASEKSSYCRNCMKAYDEARKEKRTEYFNVYRSNNREKRIQYNREYNNRPEIKEQNQKYNREYNNRPEIKEQKQRYSKTYYYANRERQLEYHKRYREEHGEEVRARQRAWYAQNKEKVANINKFPLNV